MVHADGGFLVHAHPFREAEYIDMIRLFPRKVDAVEIFNAGRTDFENKRALEYADNYKLLKLVGSDTHKKQINKSAGIQFERKIKDIDDMIESIKDGQGDLFVSSILR